MRMGCPRCGSFYEADSKFCARDGSKLVAQATVPAVLPGVGAAARQHSGHKPPAPPPGIPVAGRTSPAGLSLPPTEGARWLDYASLSGSVLDGRYLVVSKIADGGMSIVYLGQDHQNDGQRVAIKFLPPELSEDMKAMERLRREADMGIRLVHRNVCSITRLGETSDGLVYVVMPFVEGEVLCDRTYRLGSIPLALAVTLVNDIAAGLHAAHELEIIHRDLKPENVMICAEPSGEEYAVVMDFGLAKDREAARFLEKLTATGVVLGTPEFMSPEQLRGKPLVRRTDVYSLGLVTYEMLTGRLPFPGDNQQDLLLARLRSHPTPIREMRPDLGFSADLEKVLTKALQRLPEDRYATAPEFAKALSAAAGGSSLLDRLLG